MGLRARLAMSALVCAAAVMATSAQAAQAKVWHVNDLSDPGSGCLPTDCTLRGAIGSSSSGDTIDVPAGHITLTSGALNVGNDITIVGAGARKLTIDGGGKSQVFVVSSGGALTLKGATVTGGNSRFSGGDIDNSGTLNVLDSTVTGGTAAQRGGGINAAGSVTTIQNSTISNNRVSQSDGNGGAGIYFSGLSLTVTNSTITGNIVENGISVIGSGGGIFYDANGAFRVAHTTIARNSAPNGGANFGWDFFAPAPPRPAISLNGGFTDTIIADPRGGTPNCAGTGTAPADNGHNLEDDVNRSCLFSAASHDQVGVNPMLRALGNYGGPTDTLALKPGSPAINTGVTIKSLTTDQRGAPRPQPTNGAPDIGAYEYGGIVDLSLAETAAHPVDVGHNLTYELAATNNGPTLDGALGVQVMDKLPSSVTFASSSPSGICTSASGTVTCSVGTIAHGATRHIGITVIPHKVGFPSDSSSVSSGALDPQLSNNKAGVTVPVQDKPAVTTNPFSALDYHGATLHAHVNPNNATTKYYFEYGPTTSYGSKTGTSQATGLSPVAVTRSVQGLHPGRLYHYRVVAVNAVGTSTGTDHTFFTYYLPVLHVSPSQVRPGARLHVYGNAGECPVGDTVTLLSPAFSNTHTYQGKGAIYTTVHHHGFFSTSTLIPSNRHGGTYPVSGLCGRFPSGPAGDPGSAGARAAGARTGAAVVWTGRLRVG